MLIAHVPFRIAAPLVSLGLDFPTKFHCRKITRGAKVENNSTFFVMSIFYLIFLTIF